ncbi:multidrug transporter [Sphingomonas sp. Root710]|nr:multidrug transporter [Sphingomonas sp. Root710]
MLSTFAAVPLLSGMVTAAVPSPSRPVTDPRSIVSPENPLAAPIPVTDLTFTRGYQDAAWSADGKSVFVVTNLTGRYNLWRTDAEGSWPLQIVQGDDPQSSLAVSPDGQWVIYAQDKGGNEYHDLYAVKADGTASRQLTNTPEIDETGAVISADGKRLAFTIRPRGGTSTNIAILDQATGEVRQLTREKAAEFNWSVVRWAPDNRVIIANRTNIANTVASVWRIDADTGSVEEITRSPRPALITASDLSADGRTLAISSNQQTGQVRAGLFDMVTGRYRWLKPTPWEQFADGFSPDGKTMLVRTNADGRATLALVDVATGQERILPLPPGANRAATMATRAFASDNRRLLVYLASADSPGELHVVDSQTGDRRALTHFSLASLDPARLPKSSIVTYKSFDGTLISAHLVMPFNLKRDGSNPAVVIPHGGPKRQTEDYFDSTVTALASRGYVVISPNFRGSIGYGHAFQMANQKDLGGGDLKDLLAAKDFLVATGYVDAKRVGITGGSYGGYLTLMAIGRAPDAFAAAVERYGIINWTTMWQNSDGMLREYQRGLLGGDPESAAALYRQQSPLTYLPAAKAPLLALQGENDIRVPPGQTREVAAILKANGVTSETHFYPGEGHGFRKRENQTDALGRLISWFDTYLKGVNPGSAQ